MRDWRQFKVISEYIICNSIHLLILICEFCGMVTGGICLLNFLPQQSIEGKFILTEGKVSFKLLKKTLRLKMNGFLFFKFLRRCSLETFQQNKTNCVLQIWVKIGLTTLHTTRARWGSWSVLKILREVSYPIEASNKNFFVRKTSIFQQLLENKKDGFYVLNYVQTDTPDIDISRNVRKEVGFWVSLVHWRLCSYVQHLASILAPIFPKPWGHPCEHVLYCPPIKYNRKL